jgi:hypothetical protein
VLVFVGKLPGLAWPGLALKPEPGLALAWLKPGLAPQPGLKPGPWPGLAWPGLGLALA